MGKTKSRQDRREFLQHLAKGGNRETWFKVMWTRYCRDEFDFANTKIMKKLFEEDKEKEVIRLLKESDELFMYGCWTWKFEDLKMGTITEKQTESSGRKRVSFNTALGLDNVKEVPKSDDKKSMDYERKVMTVTTASGSDKREEVPKRKKDDKEPVGYEGKLLSCMAKKRKF